MSTVPWRFMEWLARALDLAEQEAVLGDLYESRSGALACAVGLAGLVLRRQMQAWSDWRPWLGLVGIAMPVGLLLADFALMLARTFDLYVWIAWNYAVMDMQILEETGFTLRHGAVVIGSYLALLLVWSWTGGFALASISGRALWWNAAAVCVVWLVHARIEEPRIALPLLWVCFAAGAWQGMHRRRLAGGRAAALLCCTLALTAIAIYSAGWWRAGNGVSKQIAVVLILSWPVFYVAAAACSFRKSALQ